MKGTQSLERRNTSPFPGARQGKWRLEEAGQQVSTSLTLQFRPTSTRHKDILLVNTMHNSSSKQTTSPSSSFAPFFTVQKSLFYYQLKHRHTFLRNKHRIRAEADLGPYSTHSICRLNHSGTNKGIRSCTGPRTRGLHIQLGLKACTV